jgi:hypothetical protein
VAGDALDHIVIERLRRSYIYQLAANLFGTPLRKATLARSCPAKHQYGFACAHLPALPRGIDRFMGPACDRFPAMGIIGNSVKEAFSNPGLPPQL